MNTAALAAAKAYATQSQMPTKAPGAGGESGFGEMLEATLDGVREMGSTVDAGIKAQAAGKAEIVDVVTAVAEAELTVQTIVSVRDRMISAYQEIMRMPL